MVTVMKVGINALSITPNSTGGGTTYLLELILHISKIDHRNRYVLFIRKDSRHHFDDYGNNFRFISIPMPPLLSVAFRILIDQLAMPLLAWKYKLDVLFCPVDNLPFWLPCSSVMVVQNLLFFHIREIFPMENIKKRRFRLKLRIQYHKYTFTRSILKADRIITVSDNAKREIAEISGVSESRISTIYHGVGSDFDECNRTTSDFNFETEYILYVGAVVPYKNIEGIIKAMSILKKEYSILHQLVIAGSDHSGYASHLQFIADSLGVSDQVRFLGHVPYRNLPHLYSRAKVFVLLSLCESFGLPILEAMACGCPVVCSNASSLPEIAGNGAVLVDPKNPYEVANAIKKLLEDEDYSQRMTTLGKLRAQEFSWDRTAYQTISVIEQAGEKSICCNADSYKR